MNGDVTVISITDSPSTQVIQVPASNVSVVEVVPGPGSPTGGTLDPIVDWFTGTGGPPDALIGAGPGDMYIDITNGLLYQLR